MDRIVIDKMIDVGDVPFENLNKELENNDFFLFLTNLNKDLIVDYKKEDDNIISLYIKNITDDCDDELSLIRFKYSYRIENGAYILEAISDKDFETDDFFVIDFDKFTIRIAKDNFNFFMEYNPKKYPKCVIMMIQKYFERIFNNFQTFINL